MIIFLFLNALQDESSAKKDLATKEKNSENIVKGEGQGSSEQNKSIASSTSTASVTKGTPILIKRKNASSGECDDCDVKKPSLENFAQSTLFRI